MRLRSRLQRLECRSVLRRDIENAAMVEIWLPDNGRGGPPPGHYGSRMRIWRRHDYRTTGALYIGMYLPEMDKEKLDYLDGLLHVFTTLTADQSPAW